MPFDRRDMLIMSAICLKHLLRVADQVGQGAFQLDLDARHAARAELLLLGAGCGSGGRAIGQRARQQKKRKAGGTARGAFRAGQHQRKARIRVGQNICRRIAATQPFECLAIVETKPTSEPACCSVMNIAPWVSVSMSCEGQLRAGSARPAQGRQTFG